MKNNKVVRKYNIEDRETISQNEITSIFHDGWEKFSFCTPRFVANLYTLNYYAMEADGAERYIYRYNLKCEEYISPDTSWNMMNDLEHLFRKVTLGQNILRSMKLLNQKSLTNIILERYKFLLN
ncbi:hypothetical protein RBA63_13930 [Brenneria goodwinii]|uniref:hypothetical protein n=1 Tax=Brenneria goodwinii TaxID=1109412 RepID=UPI0036EF638B